jgi:hypothetical protein
MCAAKRVPVLCGLTQEVPTPLQAVCDGVDVVVSRKATDREIALHRAKFSVKNMQPAVDYILETPYFFTDAELFGAEEGLQERRSETKTKKKRVVFRNAGTAPERR